MDILDLSGVRFRWPVAEQDSIDIDRLTISRGQHTFLSGPSGSGKSTLLNLVSGVISPRSGSICVSGKEISGLPAGRRDRIRADHIGYIFQQFNLIPYLNAVENVMLPCRFSSPRQRQSIKQSGSVREEATRLLGALFPNTMPGDKERVSRLSVGQQQRVAAARALIGRPDLIIADEPTSALDPGARERFMTLLMEEALAAESTLLLVSHDPQLKSQFPNQLELTDLNRAATT